jgi:hypothetical protein
MSSLVPLQLHVLTLQFRSQARLEVEIAFLQHQLNALRRQVPARSRLTVTDRPTFV